MALSRDLILIYAASAQTGPFSSLSFLAVPDNRRKNMENRLLTLFKKSGKGKKLENADLTKHDTSDQKALKEVMSAMQSSNVMKWRSASYTGKPGSRTGQLTTILIDEIAGLYPSCEFVIYYDPEQIQGSFLKNALRRSSQNVRLEEGHAGENPFLQCALLMGQLAGIKAGLPKSNDKEKEETEIEVDEKIAAAASTWTMLLEQLATMEKYQKDWVELNGELLLLDAKMPAEQKQVMKELLEKNPALSSSRIWSSLGRTFLNREALNLLKRLFEVLSTEEFSAVSVNRLQKDPAWFETLLQKKTNPNPAPDLDQKKLQEEKVSFLEDLHQGDLDSMEKLDARIDELLSAICAKEAAESKKPKNSTDYYVSYLTETEHPELLLVPAKNAALQNDWLRPVKKRTEESTAAGRLRAKEQLVNFVLEQNEPVVLRLEQKNDFAPLLEYLEVQPEDKQVIHLSARSFPALRRYLMKNNVFLDVHATSCAESPLLEAAFLIHERLQDESLVLPEIDEEKNGENPAPRKKAKKIPYFREEALADSLNREKLDLLCDPAVSVSLCRKMAMAFAQSLEPEKVRILKEALDPESFQKEVRLMILPYLFTARFVRLFQENVQYLSDEQLDFVTLPGISYEKAKTLIQAFKDGLSLETVSHAITRSQTLNTMQNKIEKLKSESNKSENKKIENQSEMEHSQDVKSIRALPQRELRKEIDWKILNALTPYLEETPEEDLRRLQEVSYAKLIKTLNLS